MNKLLIISRDLQYITDRVRALELPDLEIYSTKDRQQTAEYAKVADIFLAQPIFASPYLAEAKNLKWFQSIFAGVEALTEAGMRSDYMLTNVRDTYGVAMTEYVFSYVLAFERDTFDYLQLQEQRVWKQKPYGDLSGKVMAIAGAGSIGKDIARISKAFGMKTIGLKATPGQVENFDEIYTTSAMEEFFSQADYLVSVLPRTPETNCFFCKKTFEQMKKGAVFINVGRGNAVDVDDLRDALMTGTLRAAVLDVFEQEPLPQESPLWSVPNLYLTPHVSGYVLSERIFEIFSENYTRYLNDEPLLYQVDFRKGY